MKTVYKIFFSGTKIIESNVDDNMEEFSVFKDKEGKKEYKMRHFYSKFEDARKDLIRSYINKIDELLEDVSNINNRVYTLQNVHDFETYKKELENEATIPNPY